MGLVGGIPAGLPGNPERDDAWFCTHWMDTDRAQELLSYQHHSWPDMLAEIAERAGPQRHLLRLVAPLARLVLARLAPYHGSGRRYADPWPGDPALAGRSPAVRPARRLTLRPRRRSSNRSRRQRRVNATQCRQRRVN